MTLWLFLAFEGDRYRAAWRGKFDGVREHVPEGLLEASGVSRYEDIVGFEVLFELETALLRSGAKAASS